MSYEVDNREVVMNDFISIQHDDHRTSNSNSCCSSRCVLKFLRSNLLLILMILSLGIGIGMGAGMRSLDPPLDERQQMYFKFPGDLLMRMLKCMIVPLVVSSLICGVAGLTTSASGRIGLTAIIYYMVTTVSAALLGILLVCTIQPGFRAGNVDIQDDSMDEGNIADSFLDLIRNMFPDNVVEAAFRQTKTYQVPVEVANTTACKNTTDPAQCNYTYVVYDFDIRKEDSMNVLGLVVYSLAMGIALSLLGDAGKPLYHVCQSIAEATMLLVSAIIWSAVTFGLLCFIVDIATWYSPIGICFLVAAEIIAMEDPMAELASLGYYMMTVLVGLFIHGLIILPLIYLVVVRRNPLTYLLGALQALVTAFGTASSSATLPVTYKCLEVNNKIDRGVTRFILPIGATINMDGTALYEAVAAIYIAQSNGMHLNAAQIVTTSITATFASIGAASVPQAGLVTMVMVLSAIGLPADQVTKILAIDWLLDRFRTAVNVEGDCIGAGVVSHTCRKQLQQQAEDEDNGMTSDNDKLPAYSSMSESSSNSDVVNCKEKIDEIEETWRF